MKKENKARKRAPGLPGGVAAVDETFESPVQLSGALDAFLAFLRRRYSKSLSSGKKPNVFGFVVRRMEVVRDVEIREVSVSSDLAMGVATILASAIPNESNEDWETRRNDLLSIFWPSMQDAQIRAVVQLYKALNADARKALENEFHEETRRGESPSSFTLITNINPNPSQYRVRYNYDERMVVKALNFLDLAAYQNSRGSVLLGRPPRSLFAKRTKGLPIQMSFLMVGRAKDRQNPANSLIMRT